MHHIFCIVSMEETVNLPSIVQDAATAWLFLTVFMRCCLCTVKLSEIVIPVFFKRHFILKILVVTAEFDNYWPWAIEILLPRS